MSGDTRVCRQEVRTAAPRSRVWESLTDPRRLCQWYTDRASGEPKPGSTYVWEFAGFETMRLAVKEVDPEKRLVLEPSGALAGSTVEIWMLSEGKGTRAGIAQAGVPADEAIDSGWRLTLALMREYAENHFGRDKESTFLVRPTKADYDRVRPFYVESSGLAEWLLDAGRIAKPGSPFQWKLKGGLGLSGRILSDSGLELSLFADELDGVLEVKTFAQGETGNAVAIRITSWNPRAPQLAEYKKAFEAALDRLAARLG